MTKIPPTSPRSPEESSSGLIMSNAPYLTSVMSNINTLLNRLRNTQNTTRQQTSQNSLQLSKIAADQTERHGEVEQLKSNMQAFQSISSCVGNILQAGGSLVANAVASSKIDRENQPKIQRINSDLAKLENPKHYAPRAVMSSQTGQPQVAPVRRTDIEAKIRSGTLGGPLTNEEIACLSQKGNADLKAQAIKYLQNERGKIDQLIADRKHSEQRTIDNISKFGEILGNLGGVAFKMKEGEVGANAATFRASIDALNACAQSLQNQASASGEQASNLQQKIEQYFSTLEKLISSLQFRS